MRFNNISRMIVILSFFFFNKVNIFSEINNYVKVKYENITLWDLTPQLVEKSKAENIILLAFCNCGLRFNSKNPAVLSP